MSWKFSSFHPGICWNFVSVKLLSTRLASSAVFPWRLGVWSRRVTPLHFSVSQQLFRKDLISAMKMADTEPLQSDDYIVITDPWRMDWEKGVQVPVHPHEKMPTLSVRCDCSTYPNSVLPRPFLQGAAPCPFLVTPCPFWNAEMTPCPFDQIFLI